MSLTDPRLLGLVFDCGHYRFGGGDPEEGLRKYGQRVWHFHFKDYAAGRWDKQASRRRLGLLPGGETWRVL